MIGKRLSHFRILSKIGEGGMGVVYRAQDEKLGRQVALKVLQPEFVGSEDRRLRFLREARTAAAVTHPHIAAIHEIDEVEGVIFIAMELVEGKTLGSLISGRPLPRRDALRIAIEIAEALARAHQANVIHRDLKPENIIVSPDRHVKILDFGLAKLREEPGGAPTDEASRMRTISAEMTREGRVLGTAAYMSPEQARGLAVDARSDLFSFGILLYEIVTGRAPFQGTTVTDTLTAILRDVPVPPAQHNPEVPVELERIIEKCLEKDPKDRYQHADEIVVDLRKLKRESDSQPLPRMSDTGVQTIPAKAAWLRPLPIAIGVLVLVALALYVPRLFRSGSLAPPVEAGVNSLAVLPFVNLKDSADPDRLGQILQELIITDLSEIKSLKIFSSQRLFDIQKQLGRGERKTIDREVATEVASRAGARTMLTGSLSQLGPKWILTGQLVNVSDGAVIKSERIDGSDLYSMADRLTAQIRTDLGLEGTGEESLALAVKEKTTTSIEAYQQYLAGVEHLNDRDFDKAVDEFEKAVSIDPTFGQAHYKLAIAAWWFDPSSEWWVGREVASPGEILTRLLSGEFKLSQKDRSLAEAFLPLVERRYVEALEPFERLVKEYPEEKEAWYGLGEARYHRPDADPMPALRAFVKALDLDPSFRLSYRHVSDIYLRKRMYDEGIAKIRSWMERAPDDPSWYRELAQLAIAKGEPSEVEAIIAEALEHATDPQDRHELLLSVGSAYSEREDHATAERHYREALAVTSATGRDKALSRLGWSFFNRDNFGEAENYFLEALNVNPTSPGALEGLVATYGEERRFGDAMRRAKSMIEMNPDYSPYYHMWIRAAVMVGDEKEVDSAIKAGIEHSSTKNEKKWVWMRAAEAYEDVGDVVKGDELLQKALVLAESEDLTVPTELGFSALALRKFDEAEERFRKAQELFPDHVPALFGLTFLSIGRAQYEDAIRYGKKITDQIPDAPFAHVVWIGAHIGAGRLREADSLLQTSLSSIRIPKARQSLILQVGQAYIGFGMYEKAETLIRRAAELDQRGEDEDTFKDLGIVLTLLGRYDEAEDAYRKARSIAPRDAGILSGLATLRLLQKDNEAAERELRGLLAAGPKHRYLYQLLACILTEQRRFSEAESLARKAMSMDPGRQAHALLAWVLISGESDVGRGIKLAQEALEFHEDPWETFRVSIYMPTPEHCLGLAYLKRGDYDKAVKFLEKAKGLHPHRPSVQEHLQLARNR